MNNGVVVAIHNVAVMTLAGWVYYLSDSMWAILILLFLAVRAGRSEK